MVSKQKILIVDDDNNIAELISLYLTKECFETKIVNDGESALGAVEEFAPNLILLDLMLPGIDGYQVCREVRAKNSVPIIMLSAKGEVFDKVLHTSIPFFLEFVKLVKEHHITLKSVYNEVLILQSDSDQVVPIENGIKIYDDLGSKNKYLTYLKEERHEILNGEDENAERKKEIAEYIRLFLKGGYKWRMTWKEKI